MTTTTLTVAEMILEQLGGRQFVAMTGARDLLEGPDSLQLKIGSGVRAGCNCVRIVLDASDTYTVTFYRLAKRGLDINELATVSLVYGDSLRAVFESHTGFATSL